MARHHKSKRMNDNMRYDGAGGSHDSGAVYRAVDSDYEGEKSRHVMQREDGSMISQDKSAMAGLPRRIMYKAYPKAEYDLDGELYGNIVGIDRQMDEDASVVHRVKGHPRKI